MRVQRAGTFKGGCRMLKNNLHMVQSLKKGCDEVAHSASCVGIVAQIAPHSVFLKSTIANELRTYQAERRRLTEVLVYLPPRLITLRDLKQPPVIPEDIEVQAGRRDNNIEHSGYDDEVCNRNRQLPGPNAE